MARRPTGPSSPTGRARVLRHRPGGTWNEGNGRARHPGLAGGQLTGVPTPPAWGAVMGTFRADSLRIARVRCQRDGGASRVRSAARAGGAGDLGEARVVGEQRRVELARGGEDDRVGEAQVRALGA